MVNACPKCGAPETECITGTYLGNEKWETNKFSCGSKRDVGIRGETWDHTDRCYITELERKLEAIALDRDEVLVEIGFLREIPTLNKRKCHDCGNVAWHADSVTPYVLCRKCGSRDTRKVKT